MFNRVLQKLQDRRNRILNGSINCIPLPFKRFSRDFPGIEQGKYYHITANQKIGKSKFTDYAFVYEPFFYMMDNPDKLSVRVLYFTLEISKDEKFNEFLSHLLFRLTNGDIRISPTDLKSTRQDKPLSQEIIDILQTDRFQYYIKKYEECVEYIDDIKNPTGIYKYCRDYAIKNGILHKIKKKYINSEDIEVEIDVVSHYESSNPNEYRIIIADNASNLSTEKGMGIMDTITKMSKYFITLRDQFWYSPVLVQHQAQSQESVDNIKMDRIKPSASGLADCKTTIRDVNMSIGLYSPFKFGLTSYEKYDITKFRNRIRFMEVIDDRDNGVGGYICPLFFDGAVSAFKELPLPNDIDNLQKVYNVISKLDNENNILNNNLSFIYSPINLKLTHKIINYLKRKIKWQLL